MRMSVSTQCPSMKNLEVLDIQETPLEALSTKSIQQSMEELPSVHTLGGTAQDEQVPPLS